MARRVGSLIAGAGLNGAAWPDAPAGGVAVRLTRRLVKACERGNSPLRGYGLPGGLLLQQRLHILP